MKVLIAGCGSIGSRHIWNLNDLGITDFCFYDPEIDKIKILHDSFPKAKFAQDIENINYHFDMAFVCSPSSMHVKNIYNIYDRCDSIFVEKPISNSLLGIEKLLDIIKEKNIINMVGMCYRFNPIIMKIKEILESKIFGNTYAANICFGHYLPHWHPKKDYLQGYSARLNLGGGVLLTTGSHVIDLIEFLFDEILESKFFIERLSNVTVDVDDYACGTVKTKSGTSVVCQIDFLHIPKTSDITIICERGKIICDLLREQICLKDDKSETIYRFENSINDMYKNEIIYFINCVKNKINCNCDFYSGHRTLKHILNIKQSCGWNK